MHKYVPTPATNGNGSEKETRSLQLLLRSNSGPKPTIFPDVKIKGLNISRTKVLRRNDDMISITDPINLHISTIRPCIKTILER